MKKTTMILMSLVLACSMIFMSACRSRLSEGIEQDRKWRVVKEFDLKEAKSEEQGFHYPGTQWGDTVGGLQQSIGVTVSKVAGYGENNIVFYQADTLRTMILGRTSDGATIGCAGDKVYMISFVFEDDSEYASVISQPDLRDQYVAKMTEEYGEPTNYEKTEKVISEVKNYYESWFWDAETPDGKSTQIQFATASTFPGGDPAYMSLGVVWLMDDVVELLDDESGEEE